jgi:hypothetical protein
MDRVLKCLTGSFITDVIYSVKGALMSFKSVWGFDPDEVLRAQSMVRREPVADESTYSADEKRAACIPPDLRSQILELRRMFAAEEESRAWQES